MFVFLLFGATGDLAKRNIIPALYQLWKRGHRFILIGAAIEDVDKYSMLKQAEEYSIDTSQWAEFSEQVYYQKLDFRKEEDYVKLKKLLDTFENNDRILYCSAASQFFSTITRYACNTKIIEKEPQKGWHRIAYEKPFGHNEESAVEMERAVEKLLLPDQRFYIDHFLGKELIDNILFVRFTNAILEDSWNNTLERIDIILHESVGLEGREAFYPGALLDVVQNHMLQIMALVGMELPDSLEPEALHKTKLALLKKIRFIDGIVGRYENYPGNTDTYAALTLTIDNDRWQGVPFFLRTGKYLNEKRVLVQLTFKHLDNKLSKTYKFPPNVFRIQIEPDPGFELALNAKKPGRTPEISCAPMSFCYPCIWPYNPNAYDVICEALITGDRAISVPFTEIIEAWRIIDTIKKADLPLIAYTKGSSGPQSSRT